MGNQSISLLLELLLVEIGDKDKGLN